MHESKAQACFDTIVVGILNAPERSCVEDLPLAGDTTFVCLFALLLACLHTSLLICVCLFVSTCASSCMPQCRWGGQRATCKHHFFPSGWLLESKSETHFTGPNNLFGTK